MSKRNINKEERISIELLLKDGKSINYISKLLNRSTKTVYSEIKRSGGYPYNAIKAQEGCEARNRARGDKLRSKLSASGLTIRVENLEMQVQILLNAIKELRNED